MLAPLLGKVYLYDDFFADKNAGQRIILFICYAMAIFLFLQVNQYVSLALSVFSVIFWF